MTYSNPTAFGDPIEDTPSFHWFVVSILSVCLWLSLDGPWLVQTIVGLLLLRVLSWNIAFTAKTTVKSVERVIEISRMTLFGRQIRRLSFDEVSEVRIQKKTWGDYNSRQVRGTLMICTLNKSFNVIYSSRDSQRLTALADDLREALGLALDFKVLPPLEEPTSISAAQSEALEGLCKEVVGQDRFLGPDDLSLKLRETISTHMGIPTDEPIWCFVDTSLAFEGHYGLAISPRGLYWANDKDIKEHTRLSRLSWDEIGAHTLALDPLDSDIMVGQTSQIGCGVFTDQERLLTLLLALQSAAKSQPVITDEGAEEA